MTEEPEQAPVHATLLREYRAKCTEHEELLSHIRTFQAEFAPYFTPIARDQIVDTSDLHRSKSTSALSQNGNVDVAILAGALWAQFDTLRAKDTQVATATTDTARSTWREKLGDAEHRIRALEDKATEKANDGDDCRTRLELENAQLRRELQRCREELEDVKGTALRVQSQLQSAKECACDAMVGENEVSEALLIMDQQSRRLKRELEKMRRAADARPTPLSLPPSRRSGNIVDTRRYRRFEQVVTKPLFLNCASQVDAAL